MKRICKIALCAVTVGGALLGAAHMINSRIFSRAGGKVSRSGVWKSEYGDVRFTRKGEGVPVLLVHGIGIGAGKSEWDANINELSKNHEVYALDLPGFGCSEKRKMTYNSYYYALVINDFILKIIGRKTSVVAYGLSGGFVLAGARLYPKLYNKIIIVNPFVGGAGAAYRHNSFVKKVLPLPILGTLVYNFISSRQSLLSFLDSSAPVSEKYSGVSDFMENAHKNAHIGGANNKYTVLSMINGYMDSNIYGLIKNCDVPLCVVSSGFSQFLSASGDVSVTEFMEGELLPNVYAPDGFNEFVVNFLSAR